MRYAKVMALLASIAYSIGLAQELAFRVKVFDAETHLAKYVPAVSSHVGGRLVFSDVINESFNLGDGKYRANGWCRPSSDDSSLWKHSDIKDAAYFYVYKLYEEIIQKGMLK